MSSANNESNSSHQKTGTPVPYEITAEGSLGILALGAAGIKAWRKKRDELKLKNNQKENHE